LLFLINPLTWSQQSARPPDRGRDFAVPEKRAFDLIERIERAVRELA
jgi:hypothetical protein